MTTIPPAFKTRLLDHAYPGFYIRWIDRLDEIYAKVSDWIHKVRLEEDQEEIEQRIAGIIPYLCSRPETTGGAKVSEMDFLQFRQSWKRVLEDLECMMKNELLYGWFGMGQSELEHKIGIARKQYEAYRPRRTTHRRMLDEGLDFLVWRMEELGLADSEQNYAILELFKTFDFARFRTMPTDRAYDIINRIRKEALAQPRVPFETERPQAA